MDLLTWLHKPGSEKFVGAVAALFTVVAIFVSGGWKAVTFWFSQRKGKAIPALTTNQTMVNSGTAIHNTGAGAINVTQSYGIPLEDHQRLAADLGVTKTALANFFKIVEQNQVPPEELDSTLRQIAKDYIALREVLSAVGGEDPTVARLKQNAAKALDQGDFDQVEALLVEARARDLEEGDRLETRKEGRLRSAAASAFELGKLKSAQLAYADALSYCRQAAETLPAQDELKRAEYLNAAGVVAYMGGFYDDAHRAFESACAIRKRVLPEGHPDIATSMNNLASVCMHQGRYIEAEQLHREALTIRKRNLPIGHPDIAQSLNNMAGFYHDQGHLSEAEPLYREALALRRKVLPAEHADVGQSLNNLAGLNRQQGQYVEAELLYKEALAIAKSALPAGHPNIATCLNNLAVLYLDQGQLSEAEPLLKEAVAIRRRALPARHPDIAQCLVNLGMLCSEDGRLVEAEELLKEALALFETALPKHPTIAMIHQKLAAIQSRPHSRS